MTRIRQETVKQSSSPRWHKERRVRLTASNFGKVAKRRPKTKCAPLVKRLLYTEFKGNRFTLLGITQAKYAAAEYRKYQEDRGHTVVIEELSMFQEIKAFWKSNIF